MQVKHLPPNSCTHARSSRRHAAGSINFQWALLKLSRLIRFGDTVSETVMRGTNFHRITKNNRGSMPSILIAPEGSNFAITAG
jgi:hypothetical protein